MLTSIMARSAIVLLLCSLSVSAYAVADNTAKHPINIAAQDLGSALEQLSKQSGTDLVYRPEQVKGLKTHGAVGELSAQEAVTKLLEGTNLKVSEDSSGALLIAVPLGAGTTSESASPSGQADRPPDRSSLQLAQLDQAGAGPQMSDGKKENRKPSDALEEVVVTGTHIRGVAPIGTAVRTLDRAEIQQSGYTTTEELLASLPQNFGGGAAGASADANFQSSTLSASNNAYGSGVNLRGLGNTATLVLVNGHRVASSGNGYFTDVSTIPLSAIDHIDVLADGASAVYGSDAVAGVVNIVLKSDTQGVEAGLRYGHTTDSGFADEGGDLQIGHRWEGGGFTLGADYSHQGLLDASQRSFTETVPSPTTIFPSFNQTAVTGAAHSAVGDSLEFHGDAQYTHSTKTAYFSAQSFSTATTRQAPDIERWNAAIGASYRISSRWTGSYEFSGGEGVEDVTVDSVTPGQPLAFSEEDKGLSRISDHELTASGSLVDLPAGPLMLALGASYRREDFTNNINSVSNVLHFSADRSDAATYAELHAPLFGKPNAIPGFARLALSAAVRYDHYSDFGGTTNPKFGVLWAPIDSLEFHAGYSTSFRAPAAGTELVNSQIGTTGVIVRGFPDPTGTDVPVVLFTGSHPNLNPEKAKTYSAGFDVTPVAVPGLRLSMDYYNIDYSDRLANPPFSVTALTDPALASVITRFPSSAPLQQLVATALQNGAIYFDATGGAFGPDPLASAVYLYDFRTQNLSKTTTSGFDLHGVFSSTIGGDLSETRIDATYLDKFATSVTAASPQVSEVNTVGYPARFRIRGLETWTHRGLNVTLAANYVGGYPDTSSASPRDVGSYTTLDLTVRYTVQDASSPALSGVVAVLSVSNMFNRLPPYVAAGSANLSGSHFDPANANPLGRFVAAQVSKTF